MRVVLSHPLSGAATTPPQLSWQLVVIQTADGSRVIDPVLALARDNVVHFYQVLSYLIITLYHSLVLLREIIKRCTPYVY